MSFSDQYAKYLSVLRKGDYTKVAKLDFLNQDGTIAFSVDNNDRGGAFLQSGSLSVNFQNGARRTADVTLSNLDDAFAYNINKLWFGQQVRLSEGLVLPDGELFYMPQGVFYIKDPEEAWKPGNKTATLHLADKWAYLDGSLFGNLDGIYEVPVGSDIFGAISSVLLLDRGNGAPVDNVAPIFTDWYNGKTQLLSDGTTASLTDTPYTLRVDPGSGTYASVVLGLNDMLVGVIGYDATGRLCVEPSQEDLNDASKAVLWDFTPTEKQFLGATYNVLNSQVFNDIIVQGETTDDYSQVYGRAQNTDTKSDLNIYGALGVRTKRLTASGYATMRQCQDRAEWELKRNCVLKKSVTIESGQIFHLQENRLVTIRRTDKPGSPVERHLVTGFSRPLSQTGSMTVTAVSIEDLPAASSSYIVFSSPGAWTLSWQSGGSSWDGKVEYSTDGSAWTVWDGTTLSVAANAKLYMRGTGNTTFGSTNGNVFTYGRFVMTGSNVSCEGNLESLFDHTITANGGHPVMGIGGALYLFSNCTALIKAPVLGSPALSPYCYMGLFYDCTGLTEAPELPAPVLADGCYTFMFSGCTGLTEAPQLPAKKLVQGCYMQMFADCTGITAPVPLPATKLPDLCYAGMYYGCTGIALSATQTGAYQNAFRIPTSGTGSNASQRTGRSPVSGMFSGTGGTFTGTPTINTTYYTSNQLI